MLSGLVSLLVAQSVDLLSLLALVISRAASVGFLRIATLFLAQVFDLATFGIMVGRHGAAAEANPLVSDLFVSYGMPAVVFAKLALIVLVGALAVAASARGGRGVWSMVGGLPIALAITAGLIGGISNAAVILG